jgi:hypothetical protein
MAEPRSRTFAWTISGSYATWTMAITADAPDPAGRPPHLPESVFANLTRYFADTVNLYESTRDADEALRRYSYDLTGEA